MAAITPRVSLVKTSLPGPESQRFIERERKVLAHGAYGDIEKRVFIAKRCEGSLLEDVDGNHFIDFGAGWGTNNVGNVNPEVLGAVTSALQDQGVACWTSAGNSYQRVELAERLLETCPKRIDRVVFLTTGTEADEAALRIMRRASGRPIILTFYGQYFGLSYSGQASGTLEAGMRADVMPLVGGYVYAPYPNPYRSPLVSRRGGGVGAATLEYIEDVLLAHEVPAELVAGVIVEPVIGEGGILVPPDDFLPGLRKLCDRHGWYLCIDEVLSGFGRCGKMWAYQHWDVEPDLLVIGKGLSGGIMPIAAVAARGDITERADAYVASTYSGHPAACAAAMATLDILGRPGFLEHVNELGAYGLARLQKMKQRFSSIGDVRGKGLWLAAEFVKDRETREKDKDKAARVARRCLEGGLYPIQDSISCFVRIQPPLNIERSLFEQGLDILEEAIEQNGRLNMRMAPLDRGALERVLQPFGQGRLLPREAYTSEDVLDWEREHFFSGSWVCAGRADGLAHVGDQKAIRVGQDGILLVRDGDGRVRGFFNTCRHRAHELLQVGECTNERSVRCPYHGWTYGLDGALHAAVRASHAPGFDPSAEGLVPARVEIWQGFVFVNPDGAAPSLAEWLGDMVELTAPYPLERLRVAKSHSYELAANWKIAVENYHECYHCPRIHPELCRVSPPDSGGSYEQAGAWVGGTMELGPGVETMSLDGKSRGVPFPGLSPTLQREVSYYGFFPNLLLSIHPDYVMTHRLEPLSATRSFIECQWLFAPEVLEAPGFDPSYAVDFWDLTNKQDWAAVESVQRGVLSRGYVPGTLTPREDAVYHFVTGVARGYLEGRFAPRRRVAAAS